MVHDEILALCEELIRKGRTQEATQVLAKLNAAKVKRSLRLPLAKACRRVGLITAGMRLMEPVVYPTRRVQSPIKPTPNELAEYGALLIRSGALSEALGVLGTIDHKAVPDTLLYEAFAHFIHFDFDIAIPKLQTYLTAPLGDYWKLVGRVNLAYAFTATNQYVKAHDLLKRNIEDAEASRHQRLAINSYELLTRLYLQSGEIEKAKQVLSVMRGKIGSGPTQEQFLLRKWQALLDGFEAKSLEPVQALRTEAILRGDSANLRDIDQFSLKIKFDKDLFEHLIYGTPFLALRKKIQNEFGKFPRGDSYVLGDKDSACLDVVTGKIDGRKGLPASGVCHQAVEILLRDFYRPLQTAELFADLFPGEHFNIFSSPNRVHQIIFRTREMLKELNVPATIAEKDGRYFLQAGTRFSFRVPLDRRPVGGYHQLLELARSAFGESETFRSRDAQVKLKISRQTFARFASWAIESGYAAKSGEANRSAYRLLSNSNSVATLKSA